MRKLLTEHQLEAGAVAMCKLAGLDPDKPIAENVPETNKEGFMRDLSQHDALSAGLTFAMALPKEAPKKEKKPKEAELTA